MKNEEVEKRIELGLQLTYCQFKYAIEGNAIIFPVEYGVQIIYHIIGIDIIKNFYMVHKLKKLSNSKT